MTKQTMTEAGVPTLPHDAEMRIKNEFSAIAVWCDTRRAAGKDTESEYAIIATVPCGMGVVAQTLAQYRIAPLAGHIKTGNAHQTTFIAYVPK